MRPALVRFREKYIIENCWRWIGAKCSSGYGSFKVSTKKTISAHRFMYEHARGAIPDGLQIDHLCRNRWCVNPEHLELVTGAENARRGVSPSGNRESVDVCREGHNDWVRKGKRVRCRPCYNEYMRWYRATK